MVAWQMQGSSMFRLALGLFLIALPVAELLLLIKVGQRIGFWPTFAAIVGSAIIGSLIVSRQSLAVLRRILEAAHADERSAAAAMNNAFILLAGVLLMIPGFISDALALLLLVPPLRRAVATLSLRRFLRVADQTRDGASGSASGSRYYPASGSGDGQGPIIEGEFERLGERPAGTSRDGRPDRR
jgi:UPF0716 protein FxsA